MIYCRYAPSLGALEGTPEQVWGTPTYDWRKHRNEPCVFFGLYDLRDYLSLLFHRGKKWILWAGSDIRNLQNGFLLNDGKLKTLSVLFKGLFRKAIIRLVNSAENWTENDLEADTLRLCGVKVTGVCPSFMGDVHDFKNVFKTRSKLHVYLCSPEGREAEYGWELAERAAGYDKKIIWHLFGSNSWKTKRNNVVVHGRIPKEAMNRLIANMQVGLRLNLFDGFSEITAKGILSGQHVLTTVRYPMIEFAPHDPALLAKSIGNLRGKEPDPAIREHYLSIINRFPWNTKL